MLFCIGWFSLEKYNALDEKYMVQKYIGLNTKKVSKIENRPKKGEQSVEIPLCKSD